MIKLIIKLALKEFTFYKKFSFLFMINVFFALLGIITVVDLSDRFLGVMSQRGQEILGSDLAISSRFILTESKRAKVREVLRPYKIEKVAHTLSIFSMAAAQGRVPRLISLEALSGGYPFYGKIELASSNKARVNIKAPANGIWVARDYLTKKDDELSSLTVGGHTFSVTAIVDKDSRQSFGMTSLAPKFYISKKMLLDTKLIQKGSTVRYYDHYKLSRQVSDEDVNAINDILDDSSMRVITPDKSSQQVGRLINYVTDFLGLISLVALMFSSIGLFFLFRHHLTQREKTFGLFFSLGLKKKHIKSLYLWHLLILLTFSYIITAGSSALLLPVMHKLANSILGVHLTGSVSVRALGIGAAITFIGNLFLLYPLLTLKLKKNFSLLMTQVESQLAGMRNIFHFIPFIFYYCSLSIFIANSFKVGGLFLFFILILTTVMYFFGLAFLALLKSISGKIKGPWKLSFRYLGRFKTSTIVVFLCLGLSTSLFNIITQLEQSLVSDLNSSEYENRPDLFLFDIQDEQVEELKKFTRESELRLLALSPLVRARISKINGEDFAIEDKKVLTREEKREQEFRNRGINLSYGDHDNGSETIVAGEAILRPFDDGIEGNKPLISLEKRYAQRLKIDIGDEVEFEVLGVPVSGIVHNLRSVRWTSFLPNFFIKFQEGVLDHAPKTWLAGIQVLNKENIPTIRESVYARFPNVSAINVKIVLETILNIVTQMTIALKVMSLVCVIVGFVVLCTIIFFQRQRRIEDSRLLFLLGMKKRNIANMLEKEFLFISFVAATFGSLCGVLASYVMGVLFFDGVWSGSLYYALLTVIAPLIVIWVQFRLLARLKY